MATLNYWWVTASEESEEWHWKEFFDKPLDRYNAEWWGTESSVSRKRIKDMRQGDIVVAYQAGEGVVGFACLACDGYQHDAEGQRGQRRMQADETRT